MCRSTFVSIYTTCDLWRADCTKFNISFKSLQYAILMKENDVICTNNVRYSWSRLFIRKVVLKVHITVIYARLMFKKRIATCSTEIYGHFTYDYVSINLVIKQ